MSKAHEWSNLSDDMINGLNNLSFTTPTQIQSYVIPKMMERKDIVAQAITGSGKTLAFLIPIIEKLRTLDLSSNKHAIGALIISPTNELATQIFAVLQSLIKELPHCNLLIDLFAGSIGDAASKKREVHCAAGDDVTAGLQHQSQGCKQRFLKDGCNIAVATPGRFLDLMKDGKRQIDISSSAFVRGLRSLQILVLDEADDLLKLGFQMQLTEILAHLPKQRQTCLFSATQTDQVSDLIRAGLRNPVKISVKSAAAQSELTSRATSSHTPLHEEHSNANQFNQITPSSLSNYYIIVESEQKMAFFLEFARRHCDAKLMLFLATCASADYFSRILKKFLASSNTAVLLHHGKLKKKRGSVFTQFKEMKSGILVCTDVMARGVDIPFVDWVIHFDPPRDASNFVHRCGRTARCGRPGGAILILQESEQEYVQFLKTARSIDLMQLEWEEQPAETRQQSLAEKTSSVCREMQELCEKDRFLMEKSVLAFVSLIQFYKKNGLYFFRLKNKNLGKLANSFGLLKLPKMPELSQSNTSDFVASELSAQIDSIPYEDKKIRIQRAKEAEVAEQNSENTCSESQQEKKGHDNKKYSRNAPVNPRGFEKRKSRKRKADDDDDREDRKQKAQSTQRLKRFCPAKKKKQLAKKMRK